MSILLQYSRSQSNSQVSGESSI